MSDVDVARVRSWLDRVATATDVDSWRWPKDGDGVLFPQLGTDLLDFEPEEVESVRLALGKEPKVVVQVDVTGRRPGNAEVHEFLVELMTAFPAVAQDDYTGHSWTLEEIRSGTKVEGHGFFDTQGWYRAGN